MEKKNTASHIAQTDSGEHSLLLNAYVDSFPKVKRPECEADKKNYPLRS